MTQDRETLAAKIRALLAKANSSEFEAERDAFIAKAEQLMRDYQISLSEVDGARPNDKLGHDLHEGGRPNVWKHALGYQVAKYYCCRYIKRVGAPKLTYTLIGRESARVTTQLMLEYLIYTVMRAARLEYTDERARSWSRESKATMLCERLKELNKSKPLETSGSNNALVPLDEATAYMHEHFRTRNVKGRSLRSDAKDRVWAQGVGLNLQTGGSRVLQITRG